VCADVPRPRLWDFPEPLSRSLDARPRPLEAGQCPRRIDEHRTSMLGITRALLFRGERLEARAGIEPAHRAFAELGLTTWLPRLTCRQNLRTGTERKLLAARQSQRQGQISDRHRRAIRSAESPRRQQLHEIDLRCSLRGDDAREYRHREEDLAGGPAVLQMLPGCFRQKQALYARIGRSRDREGKCDHRQHVEHGVCEMFRSTTIVSPSPPRHAPARTREGSYLHFRLSDSASDRVQF
jgi:hypothetical protein